MRKFISKKNITIVVLISLITVFNIFHLNEAGESATNISFILNNLLLILILIFSLRTFSRDNDRELNKVKANFLSNISHEIKTPLNGIMGMNNLLKNSDLSKEQQEYSQVISSCGESLLTTINDILDFSKMENGKLTIDYINFDLRKLINDFYNMNHLTAEMENLTFDFTIDSEASNYFVGDPGRIRQILSNLFNNAVKFTSEGKIELFCKIINDDETHSTIQFSMHDTGIGINKETTDKLFKAFSQGDSSISKSYKGVGLGLSITKQLVKLMDGQLGVRSTLGEGTEFYFTLKLKRQAQLLQPKFKADTTTAKCLLIQSDSLNMKELTEGFSRASIENLVVKNYQEAIRLISEKNYNIVLFDINMPDNDVISLKDFTAVINKDSKTKLIALTSEGKRGDGELCRSLSISGYLVQPFKPTALFETISIILANNDENELVTIHSLLENRKSNVNVLIVDDNNVNLIIAQKLLAKMGFHSEVAPGGNEAIQILKNGNFDLVFMDLQMPIMNGLQATTAIRNEEAGHKNRNIPIVALTANTTAVDRLNCSQVGMDGFLTKPYQPKLLEESIKRFVKWNVL